MIFSRSSFTRSVIGLAASALAVGASPAFAAGVMPLASHRAVYDLTLADNGSQKAPADASGRIAFEFTGSACEGYVMNFRQMTAIEPTEGAPRVTDMRSSTYEDGDAKSYHFRTQTAVNGSEAGTVDGTARKSGAAAVAINLTQPTNTTLNVADSVVFPTEQIERILDAARAGQSTREMKVFDGSDTGEKIYNTLAVIGHVATTPPKDKAAMAADVLKNMRRWPVSISYFDATKQDSAPDYVLSFDLYENGVSGSLRLNYGDFTLNGELTRFDLLPQKKSC